MIIYKYKDKSYSSLDDLRLNEFPNISLPTTPAEKTLKSLGIEIIQDGDLVEELTEARLLQSAKEKRERDVNNLKVEVNGKVFKADKKSQTDISNAITQMTITGKTTKMWVLDGHVVSKVTLEELKEALDKALSIQDDLWIKPYVGSEE